LTQNIAINHLVAGENFGMTDGTKGVVAALLQLPTIGAPALPPSNQIEATLFDEGRRDG
jgi:hypothetical protein